MASSEPRGARGLADAVEELLAGARLPTERRVREVEQEQDVPQPRIRSFVGKIRQRAAPPEVAAAASPEAVHLEPEQQTVPATQQQATAVSDDPDVEVIEEVATSPKPQPVVIDLVDEEPRGSCKHPPEPKPLVPAESKVETNTLDVKEEEEEVTYVPVNFDEPGPSRPRYRVIKFKKVSNVSLFLNCCELVVFPLIFSRLAV
jgi:hypothetical protein